MKEESHAEGHEDEKEEGQLENFIGIVGRGKSIYTR
jgi:hypothetical protein